MEVGQKMSKSYVFISMVLLFLIAFLLVIQIATSDEIIRELEITHAQEKALSGVVLEKTLCENKNQIKEVTVQEEAADYVNLAIEYCLKEEKRGPVFVGTITIEDGASTGKWTQFPGKAPVGHGRTSTRLSIKKDTGKYTSNELRVIFWGDEGKVFLEKDFIFKKNWEEVGVSVKPGL